jgi:hypothetical protein
VSRKMKLNYWHIWDSLVAKASKNQPDDTKELTNSYEEVLPEENLVEQKTIHTLV